MAGPFHDDIVGDSHIEGVADEGAGACMGAKDCVFGFGLLYALTILVVDLGDWGIEAGQLGQFLQILVHLLVADNRKNGAAGKNAVFVFLKDGLGVLIEFDGNLVVGLDGSYVDNTIHNIGRTQIPHVGIAEGGEAAEPRLRAPLTRPRVATPAEAPIPTRLATSAHDSPAIHTAKH